MRWIQQTVLVLWVLCLAPGLVQAASFSAAPEQPSFTCGYTQINGYFEAKVAKYNIGGGCLQSPSEILVPWSVKGAHHEGIGFTEETIFLSGASPYRGQINFTMICAGLRSEEDPWLTKVICGQFKIEVQGEIATQKGLLDVIYQRVQSRGGPLTASFSYDRKPLLAKRQTDLQAEVAKAEKEKLRTEQLLQGAKQPSSPYTSVIHPSVLEPKVSQILMSQYPVPIKLAPPKGLNVTGYTVTIQRKDSKGNWVNHTTIPIAAIAAHSPTGYTGFGNGAPPAFLMTAGRWRLNAQVSSPKKSGVSEWVEFSAVELTQDSVAEKSPLSVLKSPGQSTMQSTLPPKGLPGGGDSPPSVLYSIASTGALKWYRHNGAQTGAGLNTPGAWSGPTDVGSGWQNFKEVFSMGDGLIYAIAGDGKLKWYKHTGFRDGRMAWAGPKDVGTGWQTFQQVFGAGNGIIYAIAGDGSLKWYKHTGYQDGSFRWEGPKNVGTGWQNFKQVLAAGNGIIYAIAGDGSLKWYKHTGYQDGSFRWEGPKDVGTGWQNFKEVFAAGNGIIYAIAGDGSLKWYKHIGYQDGSFRWEGPKNIGTGWQGFTTVLSLLP